MRVAMLPSPIWHAICFRRLKAWLLTEAERRPRRCGGRQIHEKVSPNDRRQTERAGDLLAAIVDCSDDAIISKTLDGVITSWNNSAERMFGYTREEAVGQHITLIIPEDRRDEEVKIVQRLRRGERVDHFETVRLRKDGTLLDLNLTISPVKDAAGRVVGASKVARDITERKQIEQEIG